MDFANCEESGSSSSSSSSSSLCLCRICHEEEEQSTTSMESPCACSGTLKFAHRQCIQRWCDEKRSTICEICLEKFEPGYNVTVPPPATQHMIEVVITIRGSLEAARFNNELRSPAMVAVASNRREPEHAECSLVTSNCAISFFQSVALMFTILFLLRHVMAVILLGNYHYSSTLSFYQEQLVQVFLLRAAGFFLPIYLTLQLITRIRNSGRQQERNGEAEEDIEEQ